MKRTITTFILLLSLALAGACGNERQETADASQGVPVSNATSLTPEELGQLGAAINREPEKAEQLLAAKGLTPQQFEKAIRDVTESADASKRYASAYKKARA